MPKWETFRLAGVPTGTTKNSPGFQPGDHALPQKPSPAGTTENPLALYKHRPSPPHPYPMTRLKTLPITGTARPQPRRAGLLVFPNFSTQAPLSTKDLPLQKCLTFSTVGRGLINDGAVRNKGKGVKTLAQFPGLAVAQQNRVPDGKV